ncbi:sulfurtransferase TusA family protein [uncultured Sphaerochaeta sp.]|uniref:sulfurtransferase TusA family protein n=1 Tax=uncultured Sphaerochaeta sp. TaxID=886478 RepID=UPI002A0A940B|nr:sulfurtransferase TusA family protein [uncultured Sphaerochaeta sp.]
MEVDARGLSCPQPIIETKKVLDGKPEKLTVLVDNRAALENVTRYANAAKYSVETKEEGEGWTLYLSRI